MAKCRSASATIKGFIFQYDASILKILQSSDNADIILENIEDIDILTSGKTEAIQCKYYENTDLTYSVLREIIAPMLEDFKKRTAPIKYYLYGHFSNISLVDYDDPSIFKEKVLKYKHDGVNGNLSDDLHLSDSEIQNFLKIFNLITTAGTFDEHKNKVTNELKKCFNATDTEVEFLYYPNAFHHVANKSAKKAIAERKIKRKDFISELKNTKTIVYNKALIESLEMDKYCKKMRNNYFSSINISPFARIFIIEYFDLFSISDLKNVLLDIRNKWSSHKKKRISESIMYAPYIFIRNCPDECLKQIMTEFYNEGITFVDGYPFKGSCFTVNHLNKTRSGENQVSLRLIDTNNNLDEIINSNFGKTKEIFDFYLTVPIPVKADIKSIHIPIKSISMISQII